MAWSDNRPGPPRRLVGVATRHRDRFSYIAYLHSPEWARKRAQVLKRDRHRCVNCDATRGLQVHHLSYERFGNEFLCDLVTLCATCHRTLHAVVDAGETTIKDPTNLFNPKRAAHQKQVRAETVAEERERVAEDSRRRLQASLRPDRIETSKERERAVGVAQRLGFDLPSG